MTVPASRVEALHDARQRSRLPPHCHQNHRLCSRQVTQWRLGADISKDRGLPASPAHEEVRSPATSGQRAAVYCKTKDGRIARNIGIGKRGFGADSARIKLSMPTHLVPPITRV